MTLKNIKNTFHKELDVIYGSNEVDAFFFMLIEFYFGLSRIQVVLNWDRIINGAKARLISDSLERLKREEPIQYILGETTFYGLPFKLNNAVLIPRPETEELVDWIVSKLKKDRERALNILDIGTGSGCIAISLAKYLPNATIYALDVSRDALQVAKQNAEINNVDLNFIETDVLNSDATGFIFKNLKFDIIVSNPPYVREQEKPLMKPNVLKNEPHLALFVTNDDPLQFYKSIAQFAVDNLKGKGMLFFEINEYLGNDMIRLFKEYNFLDIELKQDLFKKDRMIKGVKN